mgnify:CR=1 FL=1
MSSVPAFDPTRIDPALREELIATFARVLDGGRYILGPEVDAFEGACAAALGVRHAIGVSSGSDALLIAMMALGIGPGDEVVVPAYTFFSPAGAAARLGATPVFVDVTPCCLTALPAAVERAITARTRAIVPVHLFGQCADTDAIHRVARDRGIPVIEDAAQAFGVGSGGAFAGARGAMGCFSFFPSKNLGGFGDAGLVVTNEDGLAEKLRLLRAHGAKPKYHHVAIGGNFRIDALHAALLRVKLAHVDADATRRIAIAHRYDRLLVDSGIATLGPRCGEPARASSSLLDLPSVCRSEHGYNQYVVRVHGGAARRDALRAWLSARGIETHVYYPAPLPMQPCFAAAGAWPFAEAASLATLALPIFPALRDDEIDLVASAIAAFAGLSGEVDSRVG